MKCEHAFEHCGLCHAKDGSLFERPTDARCSTAVIPDVLYDGFAVYSALDEKALRRTSAENVSDVLDAVVRLLKEQMP